MTDTQDEDRRSAEESPATREPIFRSEQAPDVEKRLERLCDLMGRDGPGLRRRAKKYSADAIIDAVISRVDNGHKEMEISTYLDELDEKFARHGIDDLTGARRDYRPFPATDPHPRLAAWVCPAARQCSRALPDSGAPESACALTGRDLAKIDLTP
ncbi:hypothetical protein ACFXKD_03405 [Nocardiopsis aegyptia]|uniref:hypothetical protein n=1 Tax=Nocardiopsis aegyptia TaxID=220378 RepID=UPI003670D1E2